MSSPIRLLLADDDEDDRFFFEKALENVPIAVQLIPVEDGEKLMTYLLENTDHPPDVLFLDLNMPRKNGSECLIEIKQHEDLKTLPVVAYSTSLHEELANQLYKNGAHYFIRKAPQLELEKALKVILALLEKNKFDRPPRNEFILTLA